MTDSRGTTGRGPLVFVGAIAAVAVVLVALVAAGVFDTGHEVDEEAWRTTMEREQGVEFSDWEQFRDVWVGACEDDSDEQLQLMLAVALDEGRSYEFLRTNLQYACPDRLPALDEVRDTSDNMDRICELDPAERDESESRLAEALGC